LSLRKRMGFLFYEKLSLLKTSKSPWIDKKPARTKYCFVIYGAACSGMRSKIIYHESSRVKFAYTISEPQENSNDKISRKSQKST
jgi:hypothetical protein